MSAACECCGGSLPAPTSDCPKCAAARGPTGDPWVGRVVAGRYRICRRIGRGGTAQIHEARRIDDGLKVALKSQRPDREGDAIGLARILREARVTMRIRHPHVIELLDVGELDDGHVYLVLEFVDGPTVASMLANGPLEPKLAVAIALQVAQALVAVHREGVVHRDLKPANVVVLEREGRVHAKLVDFGVASIAYSMSITGPQQILGTPGYMSPEYVREGHADSRSDQYSLGVLLYEMLSGALPFDAPSAGTMLVKQATEPPIALRVRAPNVPRALEAIVMRAIDSDPARRFPNLATFSAELALVEKQLASESVRA